VVFAPTAEAVRAGLADFAFAMQGLGSGPIALAGTEEQKRKYLAKTASGEAIAAFALSEPDAGSDVQAISTTARKAGSGWVLDGTKTWISNGGIADYYVVFARAEEGISAFIVEKSEVDASQRIEIVAPHPMALVRLRGSSGALLGKAGEGFKVAMRNLDIFRTTVAGAALGIVFAYVGLGVLVGFAQRFTPRADEIRIDLWVLAFTVAQRTREIGTRVALGADHWQVIAAIVRRPLLQIGLGIGAGGALVGLISVSLFENTPTLFEATLIAAYALSMLGVCLSACVVPIRRALRLEPSQVLRAEA